MKLYKLTDQNGETKNGTKWAVGETNSIDATKRRPKLCTDGVLHAYVDINIALLLNPIHANIKMPRPWEVEGEVETQDAALKCGSYELRTVREIDLPDWYVDEAKRLQVQVAFAKLCAKAAADWAAETAKAATRAAETTRTAAEAAARAADWAAETAAGAARVAGAKIDFVKLAKQAVKGSD